MDWDKLQKGHGPCEGTCHVLLLGWVKPPCQRDVGMTSCRAALQEGTWGMRHFGGWSTRCTGRCGVSCVCMARRGEGKGKVLLLSANPKWESTGKTKSDLSQRSTVKGNGKQENFRGNNRKKLFLNFILRVVKPLERSWSSLRN